MFVDVHFHADLCEGNWLENMKNSNVRIAIANGVDIKTNEFALKLSNDNTEIKPAFGLYPPDAFEQETGENLDVEKTVSWIKTHIADCVAIGEIGLDFSVAKSDKERQISAFNQVLDVAKENDLPVLVHTRKAEAKVVNILESREQRKVVLHCFSAKKAIIKKACELGFYFSVPTNIVRSQHFKMLVEMVPITQILCETDAPFLSPFKDKINEPAFVVESYKEIAKLKGFTIEDTANSIFMNYQRLFL